MKTAILITIIILFSIQVTSQVQSEDRYIIWSKDFNLSWSDFKSDSAIQSSSKKRLSNPGAISALDVLTHIEFIDGDIIPIVIPYFDRMKSWRVNQLNYPERTPILLAHEQIHFDLYEYVARRIRFSIDSLANIDSNSITEESYVEVIGRCRLFGRKLNQLFDKETSFGADTAAQFEWERKVLKLLEQYQIFSTDNMKQCNPQLVSFLNQNLSKQ